VNTNADEVLVNPPTCTTTPAAGAMAVDALVQESLGSLTCAVDDVADPAPTAAW